MPYTRCIVVLGLRPTAQNSKRCNAQTPGNRPEDTQFYNYIIIHAVFTITNHNYTSMIRRKQVLQLIGSDIFYTTTTTTNTTRHSRHRLAAHERGESRAVFSPHAGKRCCRSSPYPLDSVRKSKKKKTNRARY